MSQTRPKNFGRSSRGLLLLIGICSVSFLFPAAAACETYGIKDPRGNFVPKVMVTVGDKDVLIKKTDPQEKFRSFSLTLNAKNRNLIKNVAQISLEWLDSNYQPGKPIAFAGPLYNAGTRVFQDSMIKSAGIKLVDKTKINLFAGKSVSDLFAIHVDDQLLLSAEAVAEKDRTVQMGAGRDVSINVDKNTIVFNENNFKKGEILNVDNRSGLDQVLGVSVPEKGLLYYQIIRKPEQTKIPRENWDRFTVAADSGIFIVLIPEPDPAQLAQLDGKDITIKVFQGNKVRETRKIPIKTASDLRLSTTELSSGTGAPGVEATRPATRPEPPPSRVAQTTETTQPPQRPEPQAAAEPPRKKETQDAIWLWGLQILNLVLLGGLAAYGIFFMLPKIQVLEDRLAKNEMFIHGSREAIREELDEIKQEVLQQFQKDSLSE